METYENKAKRLSLVWRESRLAAKMSQEHMAYELGVTRATISNWEKGISSPSMMQAVQWFEVLSISPVSYFLKFLYPESFNYNKGADIREEAIEKLVMLIQDMSLKEINQLIFIISEAHGGSCQAAFQLLVAHLMSDMRTRISTARSIVDGYRMDTAARNIPENISPEVELLTGAIEAALQAVIDNRKSYVVI